MPMPDIDTVRAWEGRTLVDRDGTPVGSINCGTTTASTTTPQTAAPPERMWRPAVAEQDGTCRGRRRTTP